MSVTLSIPLKPQMIYDCGIRIGKLLLSLLFVRYDQNATAAAVLFSHKPNTQYTIQLTEK